MRTTRGERRCVAAVRAWALLTVACFLIIAALPAAASRIIFGREAITREARGAQSVFAADLDGDGDMDVLSASIADDRVIWYENDGRRGRPSFLPHVITASADGADAVHAADLDGDGDVDVLSAAAIDSTVQWHENNGGRPPLFTTRLIARTSRYPPPFGGSEPRSVYAADLDGDGDLDVLSADLLEDQVAWYENDGGRPLSFTTHIITEDPDGGAGPLEGFAEGAYNVSAADVDGDGDTDVLFAALLADLVAWCENDGGSPPRFACRPITTPPERLSFPTQALPIDLDGDGDMDILVGELTIRLMVNYGGSPPFFSGRIIARDSLGPHALAVADLDGDGDKDVLSASGLDDRIRWHENDGGSPPDFRTHVITQDPDGFFGPKEGFADFPFWVHAADLDGDGDPDALSASWADSTVAWYENRVVLPRR